MAVVARASARGERMASTQSRSRKRGKADVASKNGAIQGVSDPAVLLDFYRRMVEIRLFEDAAQRGLPQKVRNISRQL